MFSNTDKKIVEEFKSGGHCFVVLKLSDDIKAEYHQDSEKTRKNFAKLFMENPFDHIFLDRLMKNRDKYFTLVDTLDATIDNKEPPMGKDSFQSVFDAFASRLSMELRISSNQLNRLLDSLFSEYHGEKFFNPSMPKQVQVESRLREVFVDTHIDIKDKTTAEWVRVDILKPKPEPKPKPKPVQDDGCRIA